MAAGSSVPSEGSCFILIMGCRAYCRQRRWLDGGFEDGVICKGRVYLSFRSDRRLRVGFMARIYALSRIPLLLQFKSLSRILRSFSPETLTGVGGVLHDGRFLFSVVEFGG